MNPIQFRYKALEIIKEVNMEYKTHLEHSRMDLRDNCKLGWCYWEGLKEVALIRNSVMEKFTREWWSDRESSKK